MRSNLESGDKNKPEQPIKDREDIVSGEKIGDILQIWQRRIELGGPLTQFFLACKEEDVESFVKVMMVEDKIETRRDTVLNPNHSDIRTNLLELYEGLRENKSDKILIFVKGYSEMGSKIINSGAEVGWVKRRLAHDYTQNLIQNTELKSKLELLGKKIIVLTHINHGANEEEYQILATGALLPSNRFVNGVLEFGY